MFEPEAVIGVGGVGRWRKGVGGIQSGRSVVGTGFHRAAGDWSWEVDDER
jgi:hypothetical protein